MAKTDSLSFGQVQRFMTRLLSYGLTETDIDFCLRIENKQVIDEIIEAVRARQRECNGLLHGRFTPFDEKLKAVRGYPGVSEAMVEEAVGKARLDGTIGRFERKSPTNKWLDLAVVVHQGSAAETLTYVLDRMRDTYGYDCHKESILLGGNPLFDPKHVQYRTGLPRPPRGVTIELVDLEVRTALNEQGRQSAQRALERVAFAPLFSFAQNHELPNQLGRRMYADVLCAGLLLEDDVLYLSCKSGNVVVSLKSLRQDSFTHCIIASDER